MPEKLWEVVYEWRRKGAYLPDIDVVSVYEYCIRKMKVANIEDPDNYIYLLFPTELKDYLFRESIKAMNHLNRIREEEGEDVFNMYVESMSSKVS